MARSSPACWSRPRSSSTPSSSAVPAACARRRYRSWSPPRPSWCSPTGDHSNGRTRSLLPCPPHGGLSYRPAGFTCADASGRRHGHSRAHGARHRWSSSYRSSAWCRAPAAGMRVATCRTGATVTTEAAVGQPTPGSFPGALPGPVESHGSQRSSARVADGITAHTARDVDRSRRGPALPRISGAR